MSKPIFLRDFWLGGWDTKLGAGIGSILSKTKIEFRPFLQEFSHSETIIFLGKGRHKRGSNLEPWGSRVQMDLLCRSYAPPPGVQGLSYQLISKEVLAKR